MRDITGCFTIIVDLLWDFVKLLDSKVVFRFFNTASISILDIFVGFIILGFVISVFWRGAKA